MINGHVVLCALIAALPLPALAATPTPPPSPTPSARAASGYAGSPHAPAPLGNHLRVMSFNLRVPFRLDLHNYWTHRKELLVQTIKQFAPDVLGTQECVNEQAWYLFENLTDYGFVGAGRDDGEADGEMCGVFFRLDRFRRIDSGHFWLSETPHRVGSKGWDAGWRRICTWVRLQDRANGRQFVFFNTHFDAIGDEARLQSAILLRRKIDEIAAGLPAIVTGDFNAGEGSDPYNILINGLHRGAERLADTYREVNPVRRRTEGTRHGFDGSTSGERIDWVLTTLGFDTLAASIDHTHRDGRYPSDHFPVTAILRWNAVEAAARLTAANAPNTGG